MATIRIKNSEYYNEEIKKILDECARKNNVSPEEYDKIIELMSEKMRLNVKKNLNSRSDVELIANQFKMFMADYLKQAKEKRFFKANTIIANLTTLNSINNIGDRSAGTYGSAGVGFGCIDFAYENSSMQNLEFRKEIFFHEVTHHLINRNIDADSIALTGRTKVQELQNLEREFGMSLRPATSFIAELLTEEMAQQLICDRRPVKTKVGVGEANLESNYTPLYNRRYQTLGTEFIKTLQECADNNEENMMKKIILLALDDKVDLISIIRNNYQGKEDDLKTIFSAFIKVKGDERITYGEVENFFRITKRNYTLDYQRPTLDRVIPVSIKASSPSRIRVHTDKSSKKRKIKIHKDEKTKTSRIRIRTGKQTQTTPHFKIKKSINSNILGNQAVEELSDVEFFDNVQQHINVQEKQLTENENQK